MALRHREPLPIPPADLVRIRDDLSNQYGSTLWEDQGKAILVVRIPGDEPDLVNDLERLVEYAEPSEVDRATSCLLVGARNVHQVPMGPLRGLMTARVAFDRRQSDLLREQLPGNLSHHFYRSPEDPKRLLRLAVRLPCETVADVDDETLEELVDELGPKLDRRLGDVHCVYLIAAADHVRLDRDLFVQDLLDRWHDDERRRQRQQEQERVAAALARQRELDRTELLSNLDSRYGPRVAYAPLKRSREDHHENLLDGPPSVRADAPTARQEEVRADPALDRIRATVDALPAPHSQAMTGTEAAPEAEPLVLEPAIAPEARAEGPLGALQAHLEKAGFEVLVDPDVPGHPLDLAAERPDEYPQRIIAVRHERLRLADAEALLASARELDVDLALALCDAIDPEAARCIVATKVKRLRVAEISHLQL